MKNHRQDDDDYRPAKKTKSTHGPNSRPKKAPEPSSQQAAPKPKPKKRVRTPSPGPVGASTQILIDTPKKLNRPKKITPRAPAPAPDSNDDSVWVLDGFSDSAIGPSTSAKNGAKSSRRKAAPKKPLFGPLELDSDITSDTPAVLKRKSLVSEMAKTAKRTTGSPAKLTHPVKHTAPRGRQRKEKKQDEDDVVEDSYPMQQNNIGGVDSDLVPRQTTQRKGKGSSRPQHTDKKENKENEEIEVVEDSYPTEPKQKKNMSTALTQALQHFELLSEAPLPPPNSPGRIGVEMQEQDRSPKQFDPSMVDEHANRKPNLVGWNEKGPTNQGISPKKKLLRVPSATVNEQGSPIVGNDDPRLRSLPRHIVGLTQIPDTSEFTSDNINQSNDEYALMTRPIPTLDPRLRLFDRTGDQPATSSVYTPENFNPIQDEGGVTADSVDSEGDVDLVPTQPAISTKVALPTRAEAVSNVHRAPLTVPATQSKPLPQPNHPTLKPPLQPTRSIQPLTRANMETLKSIAQNGLSSDPVTGANLTREVAHETARVVANAVIQKKPILQPPQELLKRRLSLQENIPTKKVNKSTVELQQFSAKQVFQLPSGRGPTDSQNDVETQPELLQQVRRMHPGENTSHDQNDSQDVVDPQPSRPPPRIQRVKSAEPISHSQKDSQHGVDSQVNFLPDVQRVRSAEPTAQHQMDDQTGVDSRVIFPPKAQLIRSPEFKSHHQKESQNAVDSQVKHLPKVQRVKSIHPPSQYQTFSEHEIRMAAPIRDVGATMEDHSTLGDQSGPKQRASDNKSPPKTFQDKLKQRFQKPAPPPRTSPIRAPVQEELPRRQKLARRSVPSPGGTHRVLPAPKRVQVPTTPPHQHIAENDMDVTLVESDTDEDEFEESMESVEEDQDEEYSSSDSLREALEAEEVAVYEQEAAALEYTPTTPEHQRTVGEALHKLADAMTIRFCDTETAAKIPVEQFQRGGEKVISMIAEGREDDLQELNTHLNADRERVSARIEQMIGDIESDKPPPASKNSRRIIEERMKNTLRILDQWMEKAGVQREEEEE